MASFDEFLGRSCERWVAAVARHPLRTALAALGLALGLFGLGLPHFGLDSSEDILFSEQLEFVPRREAWRVLFPGYRDPMLVRIEAPTADAADAAVKRLEERLRLQPELFPLFDQPAAGEFFERHGLLYLELDELLELSDRLVAAQPLLSSLARDPSLRGLADLLGDALQRASGDPGVDLLAQEESFTEAIEIIAEVVEAHARGEPTALSWSDWIRGETEDAPRRLLRVQPAYAFDQINPAGASIEALRALIRELDLSAADHPDGPNARLTGVYVLADEESEYVTRQSTVAGMVSFFLVALVIGTGLRSGRVVSAALVTLVAGLAATAGIASLTLGRLNMISVAFAVLFIGLSIDFAIHLGLHVLEQTRAGTPVGKAVRTAARDVGGSLVICATTTAIGFYAFAPTPYRGVAELGLIAGTGMFVSLLANLTLLPALVSLGSTRARASASPATPPRLSGALRRFTRARHRGILVASAALTLAALATLPSLRFDSNPIRLREPSAPSVQLFDELLADGDAVIWNVSGLAADLESASELAARLEALPSVDRTLTIGDFVPPLAEQRESLDVLDDLSYLLLPSLSARPIPPPPPEQTRLALLRLEERMGSLEGSPALVSAATRLEEALGVFLEDGGTRVEDLERGLVGTLPAQLDRLRRALTPEEIRVASLPASIRADWITADGRVRVESFPALDLDEPGALDRYVDEVLSVTPGGYGEAYTIQRSGQAVALSLRIALSVAAVGITLLLFVVWRGSGDTLLVLLPLGLAALLTTASSVWIGLPLNFANVIVIPLLLGMGVDSSIHLVHRLRAGALPSEGLLATTTARAVWLSALTTGASFASLGLSTHPGLASLGRLLVLGLGWILVSNLVFLPALLAWLDARRARVGSAEG
ncbi:MAG: MMPL family transporter [Myxococcota bacterium]|nr:MMPL family transporter [Myxococcota bacterium]